MDTAVVLVSGGINSCVLAAATAKEYKPALMHVTYGQRTAERELACFEDICKHFQGAEKLLVPLPHCQAVGGNARVNRKHVIEDVATLTDTPCNTYVPGLIPTMLGLAYHWADALGARKILIGSSENDGPPGPRTSLLFPDHRREVYHLYGQLMEMIARPRTRIHLETPLISMTRGEVVRLGLHVGAPFESTWSCDRSGEKPCGTCRACLTRARGFLDAVVPDPIMIRE
jgi:7-cyano-7-deazaguanine synthase